MAEAPAIRVIKFETRPEMRPKRGDPGTEKVDAKGFLVDDKGNRRMELQHVDWVNFTSATGVGSATWERVEHIIPDPVFIKNSPESMKALFMVNRWSAVEPHYQAWKQGQEIPTNGISLAAWPGLSPEQANAFRSLGIRTVEEVRDLTESQIERIPLPSVRELRRQAGLFIENQNSAIAAEREKQQQDIIAAMQLEMSQMREELSRRAMAEVVTQPPEDEVSQLRSELDRKGIAYDRRWAAPKLRALLTPAAAA